MQTNTHFGRLDVIVEIVPEGLNVRYAVVSALRSEVPREEHCLNVSAAMKSSSSLHTKRDVTILFIPRALQPWDAFQFQGRITSK